MPLRSYRMTALLFATFFLFWQNTENLFAQGQLNSVFTSWGSMRGVGFAFAGYPDVFQRQCQEYLTRNSIQAIRILNIENAPMDLGRVVIDADICKELFHRAKALGNPEPQFQSRVDFLGRQFEFFGTATEFLTRCFATLATSNEVVARAIIIDGVKTPTPRPLLGKEICGFIMSKAQLLENPFVQRYASGMIYSYGYLFGGVREDFINMCENFRNHVGIERLDTFSVIFSKIRFPRPRQFTQICPAIFDNAIVISDPQRFLEIGGRIAYQRFWLVGRPLEFLRHCFQFMQNNNIGTVRDLYIEEKRVPIDGLLVGIASCGLILQKGIAHFEQTRPAPDEQAQL